MVRLQAVNQCQVQAGGSADATPEGERALLLTAAVFEAKVLGDLAGALLAAESTMTTARRARGARPDVAETGG